jgi:hypothetical protein
MTEDQWLKRDDWPEGMLRELHTAWINGQVRVSERMLRLFSCACCRRVENFVKDDLVQRVLSVVESHVDGLASDDELRVAADAIELAWHKGYDEAARTMPADSVVSFSTPIPSLHLIEAAAYTAGRTPGGFMTGRWIGLAMHVAMQCRIAVMYAASEFGKDQRPVTQAVLGTHLNFLRDCLGNPFRTVSLNTAWLAWNDGIIPKLAQSIYEERTFERMPILADALEEAGCTNTEILNHCRHHAEHVRGCWVVNLILGKKQDFIDLSMLRKSNPNLFRTAFPIQENAQDD